MKLEPKYVTPYLPYKLLLKTPLGILTLTEINTIKRAKFWCSYSLDSNNGKSNKKILTSNGIAGKGFYSTEIKPILKPLSDLTKEEIINLGYSGMHTLKLALKYDDLHYREVRFFNENHYDYMELIEKGLAVDINTVKL